MSYPLFLPVLPWYPTDVYLDSDITGEKATASKWVHFRTQWIGQSSIKHLRPPTVFIYIYNMTCTRLFVLLRSFFALNYASALWKLIGCLLAPIWPDHHLTWISVALCSWCHSPLTFVPFILSFSTLPHSYYCLSCFSPYRGSVLPKGYSYMSSKWSALSTLNSIISVKNYQCFHCNLTIPYFSDTMKIKY